MAIRKCQIVLLLLWGVLLLVACGIAEAPTGLEPAPTLKTPVSFSAPISRPNLDTHVEAVVIKVVDGDTIDVSIDGQKYRVRYIGIDTPETVHPTRGVEPYGKEASARNKELVAGRTVSLEKDISETDRFGRLLRYVWLDESTMVNAVLVEEGYAQVSTYPPDVRHVDMFLNLQREARTEGRGLYGNPTARYRADDHLRSSSGTALHPCGGCLRENLGLTGSGPCL